MNATPTTTATTSRFRAHTPASAVGRARDALDSLWQRHGGDVGVMTRTMAGSPSLLEGYLELSRAMKRSTLPRPVSELVSLAIQQRLECALCLASHTAAARAAGVSDADITLARAGTATDPAVAALLAFAVMVHATPAAVTADVIDGLRHSGFTDRQLLDVVGLVALNHLTGSFNLVAGLEPSED